MIVLGINEAHNASAAIAVDGEIVAAVQEERFSRIKNHFGVPFKSIDFCLRFGSFSPKDVDLIVFSGGVPTFLSSLAIARETSVKTPLFKLLKLGKNTHLAFRTLILKTEYRLPILRGIDKITIEPYYKLTQKIFFPKTAKLLEKQFGLDSKKHTYLNHHTAHTFAALYASGFTQRFDQILVVTCDGGGDGLSATVSVFNNNQLKKIASTSQDNSLGCLYGCITNIMGMNPLEHEYKVMGLAPYAEETGTLSIYAFLKKTIWLDKKSLSFKTIVSSDNLNRYLREHLPRHRFDHLAGAVQRLTEELLCELIEAAIERTGIGNVVFGGGVAQNVKANQKIAALPKVKNFFAMPSGGDESNAIGAAYWGCQRINPKIKIKPLKNLYLGPSYEKEQIEKSIKVVRLGRKYRVRQLKNPNYEIAQLLSKGQIIARFTGRLEFGARALGNRSILADPTVNDVVNILNHQIKSRDFWMPFAPSILGTDAKNYLVNPKKLDAPFMTIAFDTVEKNRHQLAGAIHPFDKTTRPQILTKEANPAYYQLIQYFKKITGRSTILNTSFNLHGEPIVCSPRDALETFTKSGLKYLVLENYLVSKND
ncbi:MAG: Carbamoyl transferase [Candidatus Curtissbacteria bacterium GW2011_GWC2_38_9]|uniref:Carbamoyl transferase n=3 Tax=Candidatus Curtissiibacteriota TaxID=1752717 RepID=A0A1F5HU49_9BACT|nr:MAG: Carbamoyl transferase [Candidatus Curtissbacteria bacterium GW2011_GWC2_38_9]KKS04335.1 MAG: Carbamoyl transferase [Candidatus Curtissbacteria bacterium GW2011_GWA2_41_24]OGD89081.1 MAG: hypothetical protein A2Z54_03225 [Candidatus Curtissbacteria bacterium RIFCSPHIGHO2_02_39_8]OGE07603.1 MAG: hypothetical protein A2W70_02320 [Candidatus Curtissbacteria bacterium RIFCSPLOWO2_02_41_11]